MSMISLAAMPVAADTPFGDSSFKIVLLFCCVGLVAAFGVMAVGIDLSAGLI